MFSPFIDTSGKIHPKAGGLARSSASGANSNKPAAISDENASDVAGDIVLRESGSTEAVSGSSNLPWIAVTAIIVLLSAGSAFLTAKQSVKREKSAG